MAIGLIVTCVVTWLLLSGYFSNPLLLSFGALSCTLVVYLAKRMKLIDEDLPGFKFVLRTLRYWLWLTKEIALANWDVVNRIINPKAIISPRVIRIRSSQKTDLGRVLFANSITLTPGTVSLQIEDDYIEVHALSIEGAEGLANGEMDRRVSAVEGTR